MIPFKIAGSGMYRPQWSMPSTHIDESLNKEIGWTENKFGIISRGVADKTETSSVMGTAAARKALDNAGWKNGEFDVLIGACGVMEQPIPSTSVLIQNHLGLGKSGIPTFDVNLTCLSFMSALDIAAMGVAAGNWRKALIVSSDIASAGLNYSVPETAAIFGDGAAAICIEACHEGDNNSGLLSRKFETYGEMHELATLRSGGTKIRATEGYDALLEGSKFDMNAFGIFKAAAKHLPRIINEVIEKAGLFQDDLDLIICHQASAPGIAHVKRLFAPSEDRVVNIFPTFGNQIATSIPTVLSYALEKGLAKPGQHILLLGTAAGISAGAMVLRL